MSRSGPKTVKSALRRSDVFQPTDMDADDAGRLIAQVGDLVVVRYHDDPNRAVRVRLSRTENKPDVGIIHISEPLAKALLGCAMEEEIAVSISGRIRTAVIELIERTPATAALHTQTVQPNED
jgi:hypothetical protein